MKHYRSDGIGRPMRDEAQMSDEQLLHAFLGGSERMFARLVRRYEGPLYGFICRLTGSQAGAEDLFQETFLRVFRSAERFQGRSKFRTWLYAIAANVCRSHGRRAQSRAPATELREEVASDAAPGPNGAATAREIGRRVGEAVGKLPPEQREVFVLKVYEQMSYPEIAGAVGRPLGTLKSQMRLALKKLRVELHALAQAYGVA